MFVPSHLDQHWVEHITLMDGVVLLLEICVCCRLNDCVRVRTCLLVGVCLCYWEPGCAFLRVCVRACSSFVRGALWGKWRVAYCLEQPSMVLGKRGPSTFWCVPLCIHVLPVRWLALGPLFVWWFRWPEIWLTQNTIHPTAPQAVFVSEFREKFIF